MFDEFEPVNHVRGESDLRQLPPIEIDGNAPTILAEVGYVHYGYFETAMASTIATLPPSLHPSNPAYATFAFYQFPASAVGAFELAVLGLGCRSGIRPRMLTLAAFASNVVAVDLLRSKWGFPCRLAEVRTNRHYDSVESRVTLDSQDAVHMVTLDPEPLLGEAKAVRLVPALNHVATAGKIGLVQADFAYDFEESKRGAMRLKRFEPGLLGCGDLRPTLEICGVSARLGLQLVPPRYLFDTTTPRRVERLAAG